MKAGLKTTPASWIKFFTTRVRGLFGKDQLELEMDEEMRFHIRMRAEENRRNGMTPEAAEREALKRFGNLGRIKEECRDIRGGGLMERLAQDLRYGLRMMLRQPGFTLVAALTLALGIGANAAIFSVVYGVMLRPLPYPEADRVAYLWGTFRGGRGGITAPDFLDWREQSQMFESLVATSSTSHTLTGNGDPERLDGARVSAGYFDTLGIRPILGRPLQTADDTFGAPRVALLSDGLWQRRFGADPEIVGKAIVLDGQPYQVVGVMPEVVRLYPTSPQLWTALALSPEEIAMTGAHMLSVIGRLKAGATWEQAQAEMDLIAKRLEEKRPHSNKAWGIGVGPLHEQLVRNLRTSLLLLLGAVGFVLLIACANIANLLLARAATRQSEMALRLALGAGRSRLFVQLLTESLLLAALGGAIGLALAVWGVQVLTHILPSDIPRLGQVTLDGTVLAFTFGLVLLTGVLFSLAPGIQASRAGLSGVMKEGGTRGSTGSAPLRLRSALVVMEVVLTMLLLVGAGLLARSFWRLQSVELGFEPSGLLTFELALPELRYPKPDEAARFYQSILERAAALPDIESVAESTHLPLGQQGFSISVFVEGRPRPEPDQIPVTFYRAASNDYFETLGIPLLAGRGFTDSDRLGAPRIGVINQAMAQKIWPGEDALGKRFTLDDDVTEPVEIVGIVGDVKHFGLDEDVRAELFVPVQQCSSGFWGWIDRSLHVVFEPRGDAGRAMDEMRGIVSSLDAELPIYNVQSLQGLVEESVAGRRTSLRLLATFAVVALLLAAVGIYGVMAYSVSQRTQEIGIRMALGAQRSDVLGLIVKQGAALTLVGIGIGVAAAFGLTRWMTSQLFGVSATDPATFAGTAFLIAGVSLLACWIPAWRAAGVDPTVALRHE